MKALVTGGTHGIGKAICERLLADGHDVVFFSSTNSRVAGFLESLADYKERVAGYVCDVLSEESLEMTWQRMQIDGHNFEILINNVGGGGRWGNEIPHLTELITWEEVWQKNVRSAVYFTMKCIPYMTSVRFGRVITVSSIYGSCIGGRAWFNMAKVAESVLMKNLAKIKPYVRNGITFNSVAPGSIMIPDTGWDIQRQQDPEGFVVALEELPLGRMGTPEEIASLVSYLCTRESSLINGTSIVIDGGESINLD